MILRWKMTFCVSQKKWFSSSAVAGISHQPERAKAVAVGALSATAPYLTIATFKRFEVIANVKLQCAH